MIKINKILTLGSLMVIVLTSCAKTLNFEQAKQWISEHYKITSGISVDKYEFNWDFTVSNDSIKQTIIDFLNYDIISYYTSDVSISSLKGELKNVKPNSKVSDFMNIDIFNYLFFPQYQNDYKFEVKGDCLTTNVIYKNDSIYFNANGSEITSYDKYGYEIYDKIVINETKVLDNASTKGYIEIRTKIV